MYILEWVGEFDAAHKLPNYDGKCANLHGHTWKVKIKIRSKILTKDNFVIDFSALKKMISMFDHKYLNDIISYPTAENIARFIWTEINRMDISDGWDDFTVKIYEDERSSITYAEDK